MNEEVFAPPERSQVDSLFSDWQKPRWQLLLWANLLALWPLTVGTVLLWLPYQLYLLAGLPWAVGEMVEWGGRSLSYFLMQLCPQANKNG